MSVVAHATAKQFAETDGTILAKFSFELSSGEIVTEGYRRYPAGTDLAAARAALVASVEQCMADAETAAILGGI